MITEAGGSVRGVVPDFLRRVADATGCRFEYLPVPRARAHLLFEMGEVDLIPGSTRTDERDRQGTFVHMYNSRAMLIALQGKLPPAMELAQIAERKLSLGAVRGYNYGPEYLQLVAEADTNTRLSLVPDPDTAARMLAAGRFDAVLVGPSVFAEAAERAGLAERIGVTALRGMQPAAVGIYLQRHALPAPDLEVLREAIAVLSLRGEYNRLARLYYATPKWSSDGLDANITPRGKP